MASVLQIFTDILISNEETHLSMQILHSLINLSAGGNSLMFGPWSYILYIHMQEKC